jgi:outer membrane protein OmpA-like peptidoglycan-associated protein
MSDDHSKEHKEGHSKKGHGGHGAHGGGGHEEGHEGAPEWLISFADNVALLMGFFVILLAMNMKEPTSGGIGGKEQHGGAATSERVVDMAIAIREAFNSPIDLSSTDPNDAPLIKRILERRAKGDAHDEGALGTKEQVQAIRPGEYKLDGGSANFEDGSAELTPTARERVRAVAEKARGRNVVVEVCGHASASESFKSVDRGMGLSYQRALSVARALEEAGVPWAAMRVVALGDNDRIQARTYEAEGHRTNQRVEIVITDEALPADPYTADNEGAPGEVPH